MDELERVIVEVVQPDAAGVDEEGRFPRRGIDALAAAGILALTTPAEDGGGGAGLA
ncbi:MAG: acyl-CoA dehydrogenase family protein, partial [Acidimicrobiales bacterium]